ncbi:MAG: hypothetical protein EOP84_11665, partial [Verrucomicrobiaceae bacterium]
MSEQPSLDLSRLRVLPLADRESLTRVEDILIPLGAALPACSTEALAAITDCGRKIRVAREKGASVMLIYGAHLLRNGAALLIERLLGDGWITHLATNGAGTIHDWEYAWLGRSTESVESNVAAGTFGTWDETGRYIHLALLAGALRGEGYGEALGRFICEDGTVLPTAEELTDLLCKEPAHPQAPARAELLVAMQRHGIEAGRHHVAHAWKHASILAAAFRHNVPFTVHPGIGYDIISNHPMFNGAAIGRAAETDFRKFGAAVDRLDGGVV